MSAIKQGKAASDDFDILPVRLPSGTKAIIHLPRPFTLKDGIHLMNFLENYIEAKEKPEDGQQGAGND